MGVFTNDPAVKEIGVDCMYIIVIAYLADCIQGSLAGAVRALDAQKQASYIALASYYLVAVPLAFLFVFGFGMNVAGLWIAIAIGTSL